MRILIVDDEAANLQVLERMLKSKGHSTATASSAEQALQTAAKERFDLILLDNVLPGISGMQALPRFSTIAPGTPILMMTGHADEELRKDALLLGASGFVGKPLELAALEKAIQAILGR